MIRLLFLGEGGQSIATHVNKPFVIQYFWEFCIPVSPAVRCGSIPLHHCWTLCWWSRGHRHLSLLEASNDEDSKRRQQRWNRRALGDTLCQRGPYTVSSLQGTALAKCLGWWLSCFRVTFSAHYKIKDFPYRSSWWVEPQHTAGDASIEKTLKCWILKIVQPM